MEQKRYNPYMFGNPVDDPDLFFGRKHEISSILATIMYLNPGQRQSMAIVGPRRIGKSSLLYQISGKLRSTSNIVAHISTHQFVPRSPFELTKEIINCFREDYLSKKLDVMPIPLDLLDHTKPSNDLIFQVFRRDLARINDVLAQKKHPPAILIIDEVEDLVDFGGMEVLGLFRDLAQTLPYILFIVAGSNRLYELITDYTSPFFNVFKTIKIAPLERDFSKEMIISPAQRANIHIDAQAVNRVLHFSGGLPYIINMICHYATINVLSDTIPTITKNQIDNTCKYILKNEYGYFRDMWNQSSDMEKLAFWILHRVKKTLPVSHMIYYMIVNTDFIESVYEINSLLDNLVQNQFLHRDKNGAYAFVNKLFPLWMKENSFDLFATFGITRSSVSHLEIDTLRKRIDYWNTLIRKHKENYDYMRTIRPLNTASDITTDLEIAFRPLEDRITQMNKHYYALIDISASRIIEEPISQSSSQINLAQQGLITLYPYINNLIILHGSIIDGFRNIEYLNASFSGKTPILLADTAYFCSFLQRSQNELMTIINILRAYPDLIKSNTMEYRNNLSMSLSIYYQQLLTLENMDIDTNCNSHPEEKASITQALIDILRKQEL